MLIGAADAAPLLMPAIELAKVTTTSTLTRAMRIMTKCDNKYWAVIAGGGGVQPIINDMKNDIRGNGNVKTVIIKVLITTTIQQSSPVTHRSSSPPSQSQSSIH